MKKPTFSEFTDVKHLKNFLKYLFRTDPKEKWSNENTKSNIYVFPKGGERYSQSTVKTLNERRDLLKATKTIIQVHAGETPMEEYVKNLQTVSIDAKTVDKLLHLLNASVKSPDYILVAVIHYDECGTHLHAIVEKEVTIKSPSFVLIREEHELDNHN